MRFHICLQFTLQAAATTETILHTFSQETNGANSYAGLISDAAGNLYGTTARGGADGVVFRLTRNSHGSWTETVLHNFTGGYDGPDGTYPRTGLTFDAAGNLYGTSAGGGGAAGVVFAIKP